MTQGQNIVELDDVVVHDEPSPLEFWHAEGDDMASVADSAKYTFRRARSLGSMEEDKLRTPTRDQWATVQLLQNWEDSEEASQKSATRTLLKALHIGETPQRPSDEDVASVLEHLLDPVNQIDAFVCDFLPDNEVHMQAVKVADLNRCELHIPLVKLNSQLVDLGEKDPAISMRWIHVCRAYNNRIGSITYTLRDIFSKTEGFASPPAMHDGLPISSRCLEQSDIADVTHRWLVRMCLEQLNDNYSNLEQFCESQLSAVLDGEPSSWLSKTMQKPKELFDDTLQSAYLDGMFAVQVGRESSGYTGARFSGQELNRLRLTFPSVFWPICVSKMFYVPRDDGTLLSFGNGHLLHSVHKQCIGSSRGQDFLFFREIFNDYSIRLQSQCKVTTEWFLAYLKLKLSFPYSHVGASLRPTSPIHHTAIISSILNDYRDAARELIRQRSRSIRGEQARDLVLEYVKCMDEMGQISQYIGTYLDEANKLSIGSQSQDFDRQFREPDLLNERDHMDDHLKSIRQDLQVDLKHHQSEFTKLSQELKSSLDVIFQLRTLETNEATLLAESNNRAILVFTVITIIFLPLSFFTSYFGMNLSDIRNIDQTQGFFWAVCGTSTVIICALTLVFGFKERLGSKMAGVRRRAGRTRYFPGLLRAMQPRYEDDDEETWRPSNDDYALYTGSKISLPL